MRNVYQKAAQEIDSIGEIVLHCGKTSTGAYCFYPRITIVDTLRARLVNFKNTIGFGYVTVQPHYRPRDLPSYYWTMPVHEIVELLPKISEHLVTKKDQSLLLIEACEVNGEYEARLKRKEKGRKECTDLLNIAAEIQLLNNSLEEKKYLKLKSQYSGIS